MSIGSIAAETVPPSYVAVVNSVPTGIVVPAFNRRVGVLSRHFTIWLLPPPYKSRCSVTKNRAVAGRHRVLVIHHISYMYIGIVKSIKPLQYECLRENHPLSEVHNLSILDALSASECFLTGFSTSLKAASTANATSKYCSLPAVGNAVIICISK